MTQRIIKPKKDTPSAQGALLTRRRHAYPEHTAIVFGIIMLTIFPLLVGPGGYTNITEFKYNAFVVFTILFLVAAMLALLAFVLDKKARAERLADGLQRLSLPQILLIGFMLSTSVSAIMTPYQYNVWVGQGRYEGLLSVLLYGAIFLLLSFWGEYTDWYIYGLCGAMILFVLLGLPQLSGANPLSLYPDNAATYSTYQFFSTAGNVDMVAGFVALALPAIASAYVLLEGKKRYILCLPAFALLLFTQLIVDVDSGKMGILAATIILLPLLFVNRRRIRRCLHIAALACFVFSLHSLFPYTNYAFGFAPGKKVWVFLGLSVIFLGLAFLQRLYKKELPISAKTIRIVLIIILAVILIAGLIFVYQYTGENRLLTEFSGFLHGEIVDHAGSGRGYVWKKSVELIQEGGAFGSGPDSFRTRFEPFNEEYNAIMGSSVYFDYAHNDFLQIGVNYGPVGLGLYVAFLLSLAVRAFRVSERNPMVILFIASATGYLVHSFFSFSIAIVTPMFWVIAGLLDKCIRQTTPKAAAETDGMGKKAPAPEDKSSPAVSPIQGKKKHHP